MTTIALIVMTSIAGSLAIVLAETRREAVWRAWQIRRQINHRRRMRLAQRRIDARRMTRFANN